MLKPVECTLLDLLESVNQYAEDDLINSGTVRLSGKLADATIDLSPARFDCRDVSLSPFRPGLSTEEVPAGYQDKDSATTQRNYYLAIKECA